MDGFKCDQCFKSYVHRRSLNKHIRKSHDVKEFPCNLCSKTFIASVYLTKHIAIAHTHKRKHYICDRCEKTFNSRRIFLEHLYEEHDEGKYDCKQCMKTFSMKGLINHVKSMHGVHICNQCKQVFGSIRSLRRHIHDIHNDDKNKEKNNTVRKFICDRCKRTCHSKLNLRRHFDNTCYPKKHICDECKEVFKNKYHLERHVNEVHRNIAFKCELCEKYLKSNYDLRQHMGYQHANGRKLVCNKCNGNFTSKRYLKNHINIIHNHSHVTCNYCRKIYKKTYIRKHISLEHKNNKYVCNHCSRIFKNKYFLIAHSHKCSEETATNVALPPESLSTVYIKSEPLSTSEMNSEDKNTKIEPPDVVGDPSVEQNMCVVLKQERYEDIEIKPEVLQKDRPESLSTGHVKSEPPSTSGINSEYYNIKMEPPDIAVVSSVEENMCVVLKHNHNDDIDIGPQVLQKHEPVD